MKELAQMPQWTEENPLRVSTGFTHVCFVLWHIRLSYCFHKSLYFHISTLADDSVSICFIAGSQIFERKWAQARDVFNC